MTVLSCPLISGCVTYTNVPNSGIHFGIVKLDRSEVEQQNVEYTQLNTAGFWIDNRNVKSSVGLGWKKSNIIYSRPGCHITIIVKSVDEAEKIIDLISNVSNQEGDLCVGEI